MRACVRACGVCERGDLMFFLSFAMTPTAMSTFRASYTLRLKEKARGSGEERERGSEGEREGIVRGWREEGGREEGGREMVQRERGFGGVVDRGRQRCGQTSDSRPAAKLSREGARTPAPHIAHLQTRRHEGPRAHTKSPHGAPDVLFVAAEELFLLQLRNELVRHLASEGEGTRERGSVEGMDGET